MLHVCGIDSRWFSLGVFAEPVNWNLSRSMPLLCLVLDNLKPTRPMIKEKTVAMIYEKMQQPYDPFIASVRLLDRFQRAIKAKVEDGFTNFLLPVFDNNELISSAFINAIRIERELNPNIRLTIMLLYEIDRREYPSVAVSYHDQLMYADEVVYYKREYKGDESIDLVKYLIDNSADFMLY